MELSNSKNKKFQEATFRARKTFLYFRKWNFPVSSLKSFLIFFSHFMFVEKELFKHECKRKKLYIFSL